MKILLTEERVARIGYHPYEICWKRNFLGKPRLHRLKVVSGLPRSPIAERIFQQFGLGYMICDKFPRTIKTNFPVSDSVRKLIDEMYVFHDKKRPQWNCPVFHGEKRLTDERDLNPNKVVVTLSGGKDGLYYLLRAINEYGKENVLPVHLARLSTEGVSHRELAAAKKLAGLLNINLRLVEFTNSMRIPGPRIMNFRDIFLMAMLAGAAQEFGARKIFIEGSDDAEGSGDPYFSDLSSSEKAMLQILGEWGLDVSIESESVSEYEVLRRMYANSEWARLMPHTHSCLRCDKLTMFCRKWYRKNFPRLFRKFYWMQCGSCFKCRVITLARILWDPKLKRVPQEELRAYISRTEEWREKLARKRNDSWDFVNDPSLVRLLTEAKERAHAE